MKKKNRKGIKGIVCRGWEKKKEKKKETFSLSFASSLWKKKLTQAFKHSYQVEWVGDKKVVGGSEKDQWRMYGGGGGGGGGGGNEL